MSDEVASDKFLDILVDVCMKTASNGRILNSRMQTLWNKHVAPFDVDFHPIRPLKFDKETFIGSIEERILVLETCENILVDTYWAIKLLAKALFQEIPPKLNGIHPEFVSEPDTQKFMLKIAERFVNSLMNFFSIEKDIVPSHVLIYGKINTFLRVKKSITNENILSMLNKDGFTISKDLIHETMQKFIELELVTLDENDPYLYLYSNRLTLTEAQEEVIKLHFSPLVDWAINCWRSVFNIRELNTPIPKTYPNREQLAHVVSYAATQGFTNAHFCIKEIKKYFQETFNSG
ncbi:MAG: hypothetical protein ACFFCS_05105 [Candidatus Hodarchaeota archaeon]